MAAALLLIVEVFAVAMVLGTTYLISVNSSPGGELWLGLNTREAAVLSIFMGGSVACLALACLLSSIECPGCGVPFWLDARKKIIGTRALIGVVRNGPQPCPRCAAINHKTKQQQNGTRPSGAIAKPPVTRHGRYKRKQSPAASPKSPGGNSAHE
jgi:hypothetical protein